MRPTNKFRHVWATVSDGNGDVTILRTQQWLEAEGWEHDDIIKIGGFWENIPIEIDVDPLHYLRDNL